MAEPPDSLDKPLPAGQATYCGRFAPSPTGPLHFGSLVAAVASYLQARQANGQWLLRIEDIDPPREVPGADRLIIDTLAAHGFEWDGSVQYQSAGRPRHLELVNRLLAEGHAYHCSCSRKDLANARRGPLGAIYPGNCRSGHSKRRRTSVRVLTDRNPIEFPDHLQGFQSSNLEQESGDFVVRRRDGLIAYHLAVVADDKDQRVTEVVRGIDLLPSTPRQVLVQRLLGFDSPRYLHIPIIVDAEGNKLSKQTGAPGLRDTMARQSLLAALSALGQSPPSDLRDSHLRDIWGWALANWNIGVLAGVRAVPEDGCPLAAVKNGLS